MNNPIKKWSEALNGNKIYRWLKNTGKDVQHHSLLEKCKSKLQGDITSHCQNGPHQKVNKQ